MSRERAQALLCEHFGPFGPIHLPYYRMGKIDSLDLFAADELVLFALYWHNRDRWRRALDIGGNIGLHAILMARCGWEVNTYEPDPEHFLRLCSNLLANPDAHRVLPHRGAVHTSTEPATFVRVHGNMTGNHLKGFKQPYGKTEDILVNTFDCRALWSAADFAKLDCEGVEADLVQTLTAEDMAHLSIVMEVNNAGNAQTIWEHFRDLGVPMWPQRIGWLQAKSLQDLPVDNHDGSLFVGHQPPW